MSGVAWGSGGPFKKGDRVLYRGGGGGGGDDDAEIAPLAAIVTDVDASVDPRGYVIDVNGVERCTEASRLAPAATGPGAAGDDGGASPSEVLDEDRLHSHRERGRTGTGVNTNGGPDETAMAAAATRARDAAAALDSRDHVAAVASLRAALAALVGEGDERDAR